MCIRDRAQALSHETLELELGAPPCTFRRTPKRNGADCPAGGSSLIVTGLRSGWNTGQVWSGSGARNSPGTVSYTHLRAHETVLDLVCRLLLEKKKHALAQE